MDISIHAPHTRSDNLLHCRIYAVLHISIHAPHTRSDHICGQIHLPHYEFQSTLPIRGATSQSIVIRSAIHFNPRSPYEERPKGGDDALVIRNFNPRSPYEERLAILYRLTYLSNISIHAPHTRSDQWFHAVTSHQYDFNPRSPYEERPHILITF